MPKLSGRKAKAVGPSAELQEIIDSLTERMREREPSDWMLPCPPEDLPRQVKGSPSPQDELKLWPDLYAWAGYERCYRYLTEELDLWQLSGQATYCPVCEPLPTSYTKPTGRAEHHCIEHAWEGWLREDAINFAKDVAN